MHFIACLYSFGSPGSDANVVEDIQCIAMTLSILLTIVVLASSSYFGDASFGALLAVFIGIFFHPSNFLISLCNLLFLEALSVFYLPAPEGAKCRIGLICDIGVVVGVSTLSSRTGNGTTVAGSNVTFIVS